MDLSPVMKQKRKKHPRSRWRIDAGQYGEAKIGQDHDGDQSHQQASLRRVKMGSSLPAQPCARATRPRRDQELRRSDSSKCPLYPSGIRCGSKTRHSETEQRLLGNYFDRPRATSPRRPRIVLRSRETRRTRGRSNAKSLSKPAHCPSSPALTDSSHANPPSD